MSRIYFIIIAIFLMSFQCSKDDPDPIMDQDYLFAFIYTNFAWGENIKGWYIDNSGLIRIFSNENNPEFLWNMPKEGGFISRQKLTENFNQADSLGVRIPLPELFYHYELIPLAVKGTLMEEQQGADMGQLSYYCFTYDPEKKLYRFITLKSEGDWIVNNTSPEAVKISDWLQKINRTITDQKTL